MKPASKLTFSPPGYFEFIKRRMFLIKTETNGKLCCNLISVKNW
jgi:hypothetical protein